MACSITDATGYPDDPAGLKGYNCRHDFYPFIEGVSEPNPMVKEPDPVTIDGKTYTYYQATQKQRAIEREFRELKRRYIGGRQELAGAIKAKEQQYARFCVLTWDENGV
ncbi:phage minor capsid protein [Baileyella intestinalis]|uniref:phage minor capsid protein n=1 Tax=Baileyella intestinalis TaxID=2606709 RepID=UPI0022E0AB8E|nr:phage minor capsid protein [Baileyella intestinalis]